MPGYEIKNGVRNPFFSHRVLELLKCPVFTRKSRAGNFKTTNVFRIFALLLKYFLVYKINEWEFLNKISGILYPISSNILSSFISWYLLKYIFFRQIFIMNNYF